MVIFPIIIILSITLYIYFKVTILRTTDTLEIYIANSKARIALGSFVFFFGINQYIFYETQVSLFIGILFLVIGGMQMNIGRKMLGHYRSQKVK